jgi:hypothetical protein
VSARLHVCPAGQLPNLPHPQMHGEQGHHRETQRQVGVLACPRRRRPPGYCSVSRAGAGPAAAGCHPRARSGREPAGRRYTAWCAARLHVTPSPQFTPNFSEKWRSKFYDLQETQEVMRPQAPRSDPHHSDTRCPTACAPPAQASKGEWARINEILAADTDKANRLMVHACGARA